MNYVVSIQDVDFFMVNNYDVSTASNWLSNVLGTSTATWKVGVMHIPPYSCGNHGSSSSVINSIVPLFEQYDVDAVFLGHDHDYQRYMPIRNGAQDDSGVTYIVTGGGGAELRSVSSGNCDSWLWNALADYAEEHHFVSVDVQSDRLVGETININGQVIDSFVIQKGGGTGTFCGDGTVQYPNDQGVYEDCEIGECCNTGTCQYRPDGTSCSSGTCQNGECRSGSGPTIYWSGGMEGGNLNEWNNGGGMYNSGTYEDSASQDFAHTGSWSLKAKIWTSGGSSGVRAFRWDEAHAHRSAYYSAWFYIPERPVIGSWWQIFQYKSKTTGGQTDPFFYLEIEDRSDGSLRPKVTWWNGLSLEGPQEGQSGGRQWPIDSFTIPVGEWFHVESFMRQSSGFDGQITYWINGEEIFDIQNVRTGHYNCQMNTWCTRNEWSINTYGRSITPNPNTLYMDDAAISDQRLGPNYVFS
jgi:hypothetical protein